MQPRRAATRRIVIALVSLAILSTSIPTSAASPTKIRRIRHRLAETKAAIAKRNREAADVEQQLAKMDVTLEIAVEKYNDIRLHLQETEGQISLNLTRLSQAISDLNDAHQQLNDRVVNIYKHGKADAVDVFLNTKGFDDFLAGMDLLTFIADADKDMVIRIAERKARVQEVQEALLVKRQRQRILQAQIEAQKERVQEQIAARKAYLSRLKQDVRALLAQKRAQERKIALEQARLAAAAAARNRGSSAGSGNYAGAPGRGGRQDVVRIAMTFLGIPYVWGGESRSGVDCSGLVMLVYREIGVQLPHHAADQYNYGRDVSQGDLSPGDLVFFSRGGAGDIYHVAIYIGNGNIIEAPFTGASVWINSLDAKSNYYGAKRIL